MSVGRTTWWPKDAAWHRRELIVELGEEFGAEGPNVLDVLSAWAQEQRASGVVRGGFRALAREAFVTVSHAQFIVARADGIGALDDLVLDDDDRRFTCRISGWQADAARGRAAIRQADKRNPDPDQTEGTVTDRDVSRSVTPSALTNQRREDQETPEPQTPSSSELDRARAARDLFEFWQEQCEHPHAKPTRDRLAKVTARLSEGYTPEQIRQAIIGGARAAFVNDAGKRFDDLELICRSGSKLEDFMRRVDQTSVNGWTTATGRQHRTHGPTAQDFLALRGQE